jgi:AcrR family transcriptional regulator
MSTPTRHSRKPRGSYHHGNLPRALVEEAVRTIRKSGVGGLTLRGVGAALGVSRTALYRHFADKDALLAAVARDGFVALKAALDQSRTRARDLDRQLTAMGAAYVRFAVDNQAHYRVMFGGFLEHCQDDPALIADAGAAFDALVDMIRDLQRARLVREDDPRQLSRYVWAAVHGIAMLAIDGQLGPDRQVGIALYDSCAARIRAGLA